MIAQRQRPRSSRPTGLQLVALLAAFVILTPPLRAACLPAGPLPVGNELPAEFPGLRNVFHLSEKLYSGSAPEGEAGFRSLQQLGIKTVITVDGMPPDLPLAR